MADTSNMPERIWAWDVDGVHMESGWSDFPGFGGDDTHTEYIQTALVPQWHDKPTCEGLWLFCYKSASTMLMPVADIDDIHAVNGMRYFGPIPEDKR